MSNWIRIPLVNFMESTLPVPGVYVFFGDGSPIYVGESSYSASKRASQHGVQFRRYSNNVLTPWGEFRDVTIAFRPTRKYGDWAMVELRLIRRLNPPGNKRGINREAAA